MRSTPCVLFVLLLVRVGTTVAANKLLPQETNSVLQRTFCSQIHSLDPATCADTTTAAFQSHFYESLYGYHYLKRPPTLIPLLAAEIPKVSEDGLTYTITIRKGVKYARNPCFGLSKGEKLRVRTVRAEDFVLAMKRCADWHIDAHLSWTFLSGRIKGLDGWRKTSMKYKPRDLSRYDLPIDGLKALDEHTLQIKLTSRFPQFIKILTLHNYAPVPREAMDFWFLGKWAGPRPRKLPPIFGFSSGELHLPGTGPYLLKTYCIGAPIVMVRNPNFRDERFPAEGGPGDREAGLLNDAGKKVPFIETIHWCYVPSSKETWEMFLSGKAAMTSMPREMTKKMLTEKMELRPTWKAKGIELDKTSPPAVYWFVFNLEDPILSSSKALRQAMCLAYDVEEYIKVLYDRRAIRATTFIPSDFAEHKLAPSPYAKFDLAVAQKKIERAKKELAAKGLLKDGEIPTLRLDLGSRDSSSVRQAEFVEKQFARIGLKIKTVFNNWSTLQRKVYLKQVQLCSMGWHADYPDVENFLQLYYSPNIKRGINNSNYANPEYDRLYAKALMMFPSEQRTKLTIQMLRILNEDCPVLLLTEPVGFTLRWKWLKNYKAHPFGYGYTRYLRIDNALLKKVGRKEIK